MRGKDDLTKLRDEINRVTVEIIRLCGRRFSLAREIGRIKLERGFPIEDLKVEENLKQEILEKCRLLNVDSEFGTKLLALLLEESKRVQKSLVEKRQNR